CDDVSPLYAKPISYLLRTDGLARDLRDGRIELRDGDVLGTADVRRPAQRGLGESVDALLHVIDVGVGANGPAVAPHLDRATVRRLGHLAADRGGRLFPPAGPGALRSVAVLEPRDPHLDPVLAAEGERDALGVELFPAVFVVGVRRIRLCFRELRLTRLHVAVDADRGGEEIAGDARARGGVD